ncbi:hypothetical protein GCM10010492_34530 [Saccharothrix mutabilis subsp. mutabilis]|uniref:Uncharacterized protein n=1 Tax=Saccharothrix mutabilis subsp. mutabilis TaxID=66855 RepID=A0ABN0TXQ7_9PSEU
MTLLEATAGPGDVRALPSSAAENVRGQRLWGWGGRGTTGKANAPPDEWRGVRLAIGYSYEIAWSTFSRAARIAGRMAATTPIRAAISR